MAKKRVIDEDKGFKRLMHELSRIGDPSITIGIHDKDNKPYERGQGTAATTAQIGTFHEFGTLDRFEDSSPATGGKRGVPQRSFLRSTMDENQDKHADLMARATGKILDGALPVKVALGLVGAKVAADVQKKIKSGIKPALTQQTIEEKGSSKPLIDTGQLRQSISYEVEE